LNEAQRLEREDALRSDEGLTAGADGPGSRRGPGLIRKRAGRIWIVPRAVSGPGR
jgi:hypothetical protein